MAINSLVLLVMMQTAPPPLTARQVVERMVRADNERREAFTAYTGMRRYRFENKRFGKRAEITVRATCDSTGAKTFEVVAESGSGFVRNHIIRKMIDAERETSQKGEHDRTRIIPANYEFSLDGTDTAEGHSSYILRLIPKTNNKFLIRGRIWVDAEDFAITRIEGEPAKSPSFWLRSVEVVHRYERAGPFWLPVLNQSRAEARMFGTTEVTIEYFDYGTGIRNAEAHRGDAAE